jgi:hypothetical protein
MTLQEWSFFFVRELAKQMYIPQSMIHRWLTINKLDVTCHKAFSLSLSKTELSPIGRESITLQWTPENLRSVQYQCCQCCLIFDKSWFYLSTIHEIIWLREGEAPPERKSIWLRWKNDSHNRMNFSRVSLHRRLSKGTNTWHKLLCRTDSTANPQAPLRIKWEISCHSYTQCQPAYSLEVQNVLQSQFS